MNKKLICVLAVFLVIVSAWYFWPKPVPELREFNEDIHGSVDFDISDPKTGSSINGTVFTMGSPDDFHFTIVAHVYLSESDNGPIQIKLSKEMLITSGYTDLYSIYEPSKYFRHNDERNFIEIGFPGADKGIGEGTVIIEGVFNPNYPVPRESVIDIAVGWVTVHDWSGTWGSVHVKGFD